MNRGHVLQSSPVQQMVAAGNPNWWSMMRPPPPLQQYQHQHQPSFLPQHAPSYYAPSSQLPSNHFFYDNNIQDLHHESLSQLLLGGLVGEEVDKNGMNHFHEALASNNNVVKQETSSSSYNNIYDYEEGATNWSPPPHHHHHHHHAMLTLPTSPKSSLNKNHPPPDRSSESNSSTGSGGPATKKARVQPSSTQSSTTFKVRKEKLGDRITTLHQLVSPFGKTDTASVLLESIGYIRFLQNQIEALSLPYLGNGSGNITQHHHQYSVQGEGNGIFPEDPGQACNEEPKRDLRSKGLCLVPVSCTLQVGSDNGADYWAPAALGRGGFQ